MNAMERRQYEMLVRVRDFGATYGHLFPETTVARENFAAVAAAIEQLDAHDLVYMQASVSARAHRKATERAALLARLQAISQTARVLSADAPGLDRQFQVPDPAGDQVLLTTGRRFTQEVEPLQSDFVAHGMPATFVADLRALVDSFERALRDRGLGREALRATRVATSAATASGLAAVRALNAIVTNHLTDDAVTRTVWNRERRIVYPKRTTAAPEQTPGPAAPESPAGTRAA
jgi:hypothetical protein